MRMAFGWLQVKGLMHYAIPLKIHPSREVGLRLQLLYFSVPVVVLLPMEMEYGLHAAKQVLFSHTLPHAFLITVVGLR